jgi:hypothetical protein
MAEVNGGDREERAMEALIVSALRQDDHADEDVAVDRLPKLTEEEEKALESLGPDFVQRIIAGAVRESPEKAGRREAGDAELAMAGGAPGFGLDRAEEIDGESAEELEEQRRKILERKKREQAEDGDANNA